MHFVRALLRAAAFIGIVPVYVQGAAVGKVEEESKYLEPAPEKRYLKGQINGEGGEEALRILLYITTHMSQEHKEFLQYCWPTAIKRSMLLRNADVLFFSTEDPDPDLVSSIFKRNVTVQKYDNPGYQSGAKLAMKEAVKNGWFDGYDWVVRLNPDVIIRNDKWILETMRDVSAEGIFVDCLDRCANGLRHCMRAGKIHTDFFAVRPGSMSPSSFQGGVMTAELQATKEFWPIIHRGGDTWLPNVGPHMDNCRVHGSRAPVVHIHDMLALCKKGYY